MLMEVKHSTSAQGAEPPIKAGNNADESDTSSDNLADESANGTSANKK